MDESKVLVIAYYFPPMGLSGVQRTMKFVKYLPNYNWKPIVLTTASAKYYAFDDSLHLELPEEKFKIYRTEKNGTGFSRDTKYKIKKFPSYFYQKFGRALLQTIYQPDSKRPWMKQAIKKGEQIIKENNIDVIFATAPPYTDFLIGKKLSEKFNIPLIIDYRDIWIDNPFHFFATPFHKAYSIRLEKDILTQAENIVVTSRKTKEQLLKRYGFLSHTDINIISHGFDPQDFVGFENINPNPNKFTITHSGLFQDNRTPKYFLKAVSDFLTENKEAKSKFELRFIGIMRKPHLKLIKKFALEKNTVNLGYLQHNEVIKHLLESDVLWFMTKDDVRSPGKLYEYFGARKPILACIPDGVIKKTAEESKVAITTYPDDINSIKKAISKFYSQWQNNLLPIPSEEFVETYNRINLTAELAKLLELATEIK